MRKEERPISGVQMEENKCQRARIGRHMCRPRGDRKIADPRRLEIEYLNGIGEKCCANLLLSSDTRSRGKEGDDL